MNELYSKFADLPLFAYFGAAVVTLLTGVILRTKTFCVIAGFLVEMIYGLILIMSFVCGLFALGYGFFQVYLRFFA